MIDLWGVSQVPLSSKDHLSHEDSAEIKQLHLKIVTTTLGIEEKGCGKQSQ